MQYGQQPVLWGVMFHDGSVMYRWNGHTQKERAGKAAQKLAERYAPDNITLAHRESESSEWKRVPSSPEGQ